MVQNYIALPRLQDDLPLVVDELPKKDDESLSCGVAAVFGLLSRGVYIY